MRGLLKRLEAIESMLGVTEEPIVVRILSFGAGRRERVVQTLTAGDQRPLPALAARAGSSVRMMQIERDGKEQILEIGPRPARNGKQRRRRKKREAGGGVKQSK